MHLSCGHRISERVRFYPRSHSWEVADHEVKPIKEFLDSAITLQKPGLGIHSVSWHVNVSSETCHTFLIIGMNKQSTVGWHAVHCKR